jgi:hypothetical protein
MGQDYVQIDSMSRRVKAKEKPQGAANGAATLGYKEDPPFRKHPSQAHGKKGGHPQKRSDWEHS